MGPKKVTEKRESYKKEGDKEVNRESSKQAKAAGAIAELDMFDYLVGRVNIARFNEAKRKLTDYIGARFDRNNYIFANYQDYEFEAPEELTVEEVSQENDPMGTVHILRDRKHIVIMKQMCTL